MPDAGHGVGVGDQVPHEADRGSFTNVLLVSGPSGAGKSTFIRLLRDGKLPPLLRVLLPEKADQWPSLEANDFLKRGIAVDGLQASGANVILHYDTVFVHRLGAGGYRRDPLFDLIANAKNVVVVSINPEPERLKEQFERRLQRQLDGKGWLRNLWARTVRRPLRRAKLRLRGERGLETADLYRRMGDIPRYYREWDAVARALIADKSNSRLIYVEPRADEVTGPTFAVVSGQRRAWQVATTVQPGRRAA